MNDGTSVSGRLREIGLSYPRQYEEGVPGMTDIASNSERCYWEPGPRFAASFVGFGGCQPLCLEWNFPGFSIVGYMHLRLATD